MSQYNTTLIIDSILDEVRNLLEEFPYPLSSWGKTFVGILTVRPNIGFTKQIVMASEYNSVSYELKLSREEIDDREKTMNKFHLKRRSKCFHSSPDQYLPISESYYQVLADLDEKCESYNKETGCETTPTSCVKQITSVKSVPRVDKLNLDQILAEHKSLIENKSLIGNDCQESQVKCKELTSDSTNQRIVNLKAQIVNECQRSQTGHKKKISDNTNQRTVNLEAQNIDDKHSYNNTIQRTGNLRAQIVDDEHLYDNPNQRTVNSEAQTVDDQHSELSQLLYCVYKYRVAQINNWSTRKASTTQCKMDFSKYNTKLKEEMFKQIEVVLLDLNTNDEESEYKNLPPKLKTYLEPLFENLFTKISSSREIIKQVVNTVITNFITINERIINNYISSLYDLD
jgi:hypothetical protein